jgi:UDP-N-acetylglucosamine 4-epimerase
VSQDKLLRLKNEKHSWLVTGAAGFIGSNLVEALLDLDQEVIGLDNFSTGFQENIDNVLLNRTSNNFKFINGDIASLSICKKAVEGVDFVLHQAALGSIPRSIDDPLTSNQSNVTGFLNMLTASKDEGVKRFIYAGSSSTYGDHEELPKKEDRIGTPLSPYSITKYINELYAETYSRHYNFKTIGLRYFNVFGRRQRIEGAYAAVIPTWIMALLRNEEVVINGDGKTSRDFCYIDNVIQANLLAALAKKENALNQIYNVALNDQTSLLNLYRLIADAIIANDSSIEIPDPIFKDFRSGDVRHSRADITKAMELLHYSPSHRVKEGIKETVTWYMKNFK